MRESTQTTRWQENMKGTFFRGRHWLATVSLGTALAVTGFLGLRAAVLEHENPPATVKTATRSEAAAGRGYSAVVKRVIPAVVNISSSRVIKPESGSKRNQQMPEMDPFFRQFFGDNFQQ